jgi:integrase
MAGQVQGSRRSEASESGFETKESALKWGRLQEAKILEGRWTDPNAGKVTVTEWIDTWLEMQDVGLSTQENREYLIRRFIRPAWGPRPLDSLKSLEIVVWERRLSAKEGVSRRTAQDARSLLGTILGDAAAAKPPLIPYNPAVRPRNRGRKTGRKLDRNPQRAWAAPCEVLLIAERAALLSGQDQDFSMIVTIGYTGMRWGETIGLERGLLLPCLINVEWQLRELSGRFHRLPPKDDSYRSVDWEPCLPVDLPPFLADLLSDQARKHPPKGCACGSQHGGSGLYLFTGPDGGHYRRSDYARRVFRPACDGRYPKVKGRPGKLVIVDSTTWPGRPVTSWHPAMPGEMFTPPAGRGVPRLTSADGSGKCQRCGHTVRLRLDGNIGAHHARTGRCPGTGERPGEDMPLACWLPVKDGLTPHGLRHSHKTWMAEDNIPEILAEQRLGHEVPGMRGLYAHVSQRMREDLKAALQARWEESLRERAGIDPRSPVPLLDTLLAPFREEAGASAPAKPISQIPPRQDEDPIRRVG